MRYDEVRILVVSFIIFFIRKILGPEEQAGASRLLKTHTVSPPTDPSRVKMDHHSLQEILPPRVPGNLCESGRRQMLVLLT
jgi:hypothetical protein